MKVRTLILATALLTTATGFAFAEDPSTPPDQHKGLSGQSGLSGSTMQAPAQKSTTTGSGVASPAAQSKEKAASPASTDAGIKQEK